MFRTPWMGWLLALAATQAFAQKPERVNTDGLQPGATNGSFIVKYAGSGIDTVDDATDRLTKMVWPQVPGDPGYLVERKLPTGAFLVRTPPMDAAVATQWMNTVAGDFRVDFIEVDAELTNYINVVNDKSYQYQRNLWSPWGIGANQAWDISQGEGVVVGVIDTGFNVHPELEGKWLPGYNFSSRVVEDVKRTDCGDTAHGTMVAGTLGALTNNQRGIAGVAPKVRIVPANLSDRCKDGGRLSGLIEAIEWLAGAPVAGVPANANPVEVINISMGVRMECSHSMQAAISSAVARGATVVVAAGNEGFSADNIQPANCDQVIAVGGVQDDGSRNPTSNWGPKVSISAPHTVLWVTSDDKNMLQVPGTSVAAPQVSGIIAMMQAAAKTPLTPSRIKTLLAASAKAFPNPVDHAIGAGIANAPAAVSLAQSEQAPMLADNTGYVIVTRSLSGDVGAGCLSIPPDLHGVGVPFRFLGSLPGAVQNCGLGNNVQLHQRLIWDATVVQHPQTGIKAHVLRNRYGGYCLIRSERGNAKQASMYLWTHGKGLCGFPDLASLFDDGQAVWHLDAPMERLVAGKRIVNAGLKMLRPNYAYLDLTSSSNDFSDANEWNFEFHPVDETPPATTPVENRKTYRIRSQVNRECLDMPSGGVLRTFQCNGTDNQKFYRSNGSFTQGGQCLHIWGEKKDGNDVVVLRPCNPGPNQTWAFDPSGRIIAHMDGQPFCLDLNRNHDNKVTMWKCIDLLDQRFDFEEW